jgi:RNA polymerase sigma factor (TIGR02999 family)
MRTPASRLTGHARNPIGWLVRDANAGIPDSFMRSNQSAEELLPQVYAQLRQLAAQRMANESPGQTLQATALVHEVYLRLIRSHEQQWENRAHFFSAAAEAMRRILVENARRKHRAKRGGSWQRVDFEVADEVAPASEDHLLMVHEALHALAKEDPLKAEVVKLHFFVGFSHQETADALSISEKTVRRYWEYARVWLYRHIRQKLESEENIDGPEAPKNNG